MASRHDGYFKITDRDWWAQGTITVVLVTCCISADTALPLRILLRQLSLNITVGLKVQSSTVVVPWENYIVRTYNEVKVRASQTVEVYVQ